MLNKATKLSACAAGAVLLAPALASANLLVTLQDVGTSTSAQFSVAYTPSSSPGVILSEPGFGGSGSYTNLGSGIIGVGNFTIGLTADAFINSGDSILGFTSVNVTNTGGSTDTLNVTIGTTGFPAPGTPSGGLSLTESIGGEVTNGVLNLTETSYANSNNLQNSTSGPGLTTTPPLVLTGFTPNSAPNGSFSLNYLPPITGAGFNNPFSLTNVVSINLTASGQASLSELNDNGDASAIPYRPPVPEPGTLGIMTVGGLALLYKRRKARVTN